MDKNPYVEFEAQIMKSLVKAVNCFRKLKSTHPSHEKEFIDGIHKCQYVIMHRIIQRLYRKEFPTYKK